MPKRAGTIALTLPPRDPGTPAYRWLSDALRRAILEGRLRPGVRLPASRDLAGPYGLSRGTIVSAFEQLRSEGYISGRVGSGTYVNRILPDDLLHVTRDRGRTTQPPAHGSAPPRLSAYGRRVRPFPGLSGPPARAFRTDQPALDLLPTTLWAQLAGRRLRRVSTDLLLGCEPMGYRPLREAVAAYLQASRGVRGGARQIAIVSGAQQALDLVTRVLVNPGDRVCIEDPGYPGAALVFEACGARISTVPVDDEGMAVPGGGRRLRGVRLAYTTPGHQFPIGVGMSLRRRMALLEWARAANALIFEDDYDSEFRYAGRPMPALQGLDRDGRVLFAGSFSKVLFPSLRLGYLLVPEGLVDAVAATLSISTRHAPVLEQAVLCDFITQGHFGRHIRRMREVYAERRAVLLEEVERQLGGLLEITGVEAGLQTAGWLAPGISDAAATRAAAQRNVEVTPLSRYRRGRAGWNGLQLGFAAVAPPEIRRGVRELAAALEEVR
ncbi:MAG TPA: PLP-dependent aminotransferase family protein [Gemmatimonadales bacterium]|nr:PLP-dependent aminotransferase family protein [Gemmatimonadales bacterium]